MFFPVIRPRGVDDRAGGRKITLLDFFRLQTRIDPRAPYAAVDIQRSSGIAAAAHGFEYFGQIVRIDVFVDENDEARVIAAGAAQRAERGPHRMAGKGLLDRQHDDTAAVAHASDTGNAERFELGAHAKT